MKIYFSGSVQGKSEFIANYRAIIQSLQDLGHEVIYEYLFIVDPDEVNRQSQGQQLMIHKQLGRYKHESDIMVAETSFRSFAQGQEIAQALRIGKPVLALHVTGRKPHLITNEAGDRLLISEYRLDDLSQVLSDSLQYLNVQEMKRFTMLLPGHLIEYLDTIARETKTSKSEYIRDLIEKDRLHK